MDGGGGSSSGSCYYSVLGIRKDATSSDIRTAYRKLALRWHPDRWTKNPSVAGEANHQFQKIQEAYSVLSDGEKRSMYDAGFLDLLEQDDGMGEFLHDLMSMMDKNKKEESLEDLQRTFVEMFGGDLAKMMEKEKVDLSGKKRGREGGPSVRTTPKRNNSAAGSSCA